VMFISNSDMALILGATMRLTRGVVLDDVGRWWIKEPLFRRAHRDVGSSQVSDLYQPPSFSDASTVPRWVKYLDGLDCPFCVGFHVGWLVLLSYVIARKIHALAIWRFIAGSLALNHVSAHLAMRIGDTEER
jgi:hypothetical protein